MKKFDYSKHKEFLSQLIDLLRPILSSNEINQLNEFLEVGEFGLALETSVYIIKERDLKIAKEIFTLCEDLAEIMGMETLLLKEKLEQHIH